LVRNGLTSFVEIRSEDRIKRLELELTEAKVQNSNLSSVDKMLLQAIEALSKLSSFYEACDVLKKRELLGSIFREMLRFDGMS
jgi:RNA processing factor Prp31